MINIAFNIDSKYVRFCGVLITSILQNNVDVVCTFHVFGSCLSDSDKNVLTSMIADTENRIRFYDIEDSILSGFPVSKAWPKVIYYRLLIPELVNTTDKILYLDCDIICNGSLLPLFNLDMGDNIVAASEDILSHCNALIDRLGYDKNYYYFNSGVLLIDPVKWKKYSVTQKCIKYISTHSVAYPDQDALNAVLYNKWKRIHFNWNFLSTFHISYITYNDFLIDYYKEGTNYPVLIHFNGVKPWNSSCRDPFKPLYYRYQSETVWKQMVPRHSFKEYVLHIRRLLLDKLRILNIDRFYTFNINEPRNEK